MTDQNTIPTIPQTLDIPAMRAAIDKSIHALELQEVTVEQLDPWHLYAHEPGVTFRIVAGDRHLLVRWAPFVDWQHWEWSVVFPEGRGRSFGSINTFDDLVLAISDALDPDTDNPRTH